MGIDNEGSHSTVEERVRDPLGELRVALDELEQLQLEGSAELVAAMQGALQRLTTGVEQLIERLPADRRGLPSEQTSPREDRQTAQNGGAAEPAKAMRPLVLVADDDKSSRMLIVAVLRRAGYPYVEAGDGEEALRVIKEQRPGILILDGLMPKMDGFEVCTRAKHLDPNYSPKTIIVTAVYKSRSYQYQALAEIGVDEYLTKPLQPGELISRLERLG